MTTLLLNEGFATTIGAGFTTTTLAAGVAFTGRVCTILLAGVIITVLLWAFASKTLENAMLIIKMNFFIMCFLLNRRINLMHVSAFRLKQKDAELACYYLGLNFLA